MPTGGCNSRHFQVDWMLPGRIGRPKSPHRRERTDMRPARFLLLATIAGGAADVKPGYVAVEKASGHVGFFDSGRKILKEVKIGGHPHEMTFSPDGRYLYTTDNGMLWMTDTGQGGNTVSIIDTRTESLVGTIDLGKYRRPHGIDVYPKTGKLLVTTELPSMLLMIDPRAQNREGVRHQGQGPASRQTRERPCVGLHQQYRYRHPVRREPRNRGS